VPVGAMLGATAGGPGPNGAWLMEAVTVRRSPSTMCPCTSLVIVNACPGRAPVRRLSAATRAVPVRRPARPLVRAEDAARITSIPHAVVPCEDGNCVGGINPGPGLLPARLLCLALAKGGPHG
jgi:hypothetical protein